MPNCTQCPISSWTRTARSPPLSLWLRPAGTERRGEAKASVYYAIDPPAGRQLRGRRGGVRFLQISMTVMAHDEKAVESVTKNIPLIRNNLLLLMSNRDYQSMMSREGKEKLRQEALEEIRSVQKEIGRRGCRRSFVYQLCGAVMCRRRSAGRR